MEFERGARDLLEVRAHAAPTDLQRQAVDHLLELAHSGLDHRKQQFGLVREVVVQRALGDAGRARDVARAGARQPALAHQARRGGD
jgi:hypothetical protein